MVERRRRYYLSLDPGVLLAERGINFSDPKLHDGCWLSLEMFDDGSYDIRTPEEWMELAEQGGVTRPLQAQAVRTVEKRSVRGAKIAADSTGWEYCTIEAYDEEE